MTKRICDICRKEYSDDLSEAERKLEHMKRWGPVIASMSSGSIPICPACEKKLMKHVTPEMLERVKTELFKQKNN